MTRHFTITANATTDGRPLYLRSDGSWTPRVAEAGTTSTEDERDRLIRSARAAERIVCDPYAIEVRLERSLVTPLRFRERIRATGPTVGMASVR